MSIFLINQSKQHVIYSINGNPVIELPPWGMVTVPYKPQTTLSLKHNYKSIHMRKWFFDRYILVIESEYQFQNLTEGDEIFITREKICFHFNVWYDRFFTSCPPAQLTAENHSVSNSEYLLKRFKKIQKRDFWLQILLFPIYLNYSYLGVWIFFFFLLKIALDEVPFGTFCMYYIPISLAVLSLLHLITILLSKGLGKLFKMVIKKSIVNGNTNEFLGVLAEDSIKESRAEKRKKRLFWKQKLPIFLDNDYILSYYATPGRTPFSFEDNEVE